MIDHCRWRFNVTWCFVLATLLAPASKALAQEPSAPTRTTIAKLRAANVQPQKSQFETNAEYRARIPGAPRDSYMLTISKRACDQNVTAVSYDAERGMFRLRLLVKRELFDVSAGASTSFSHLGRSGLNDDAVFVWETCTSRRLAGVPMTNASGAKVTVARAAYEATGVLVPRVKLEWSYGGGIWDVWDFEEAVESARARTIVTQFPKLRVDVEICLLPDEDGLVTATGVWKKYPSFDSPTQTISSIQMVRASLRAVHLRDPLTQALVLSLPMENFCDFRQP